ncbi:DUF2345 domain-containing protein, partial [Acinetobacter baumannii]
DFASQIQQQIAKFEKALLLLSSPDGIALSSSEDIHISADAQINQIAGDSINISTQKNVIAHAQNRLSLFAAQSGLKAVAAQGKVEIQAQSDALDVLANKGITISSTEDCIEISSPKEIVITGASSQITLNGSGIFPKTGGKFQVNAGQHVFQGGASASVKSSLPPPPKRAQGVLELLHDYSHGAFVKGAGYTVTDNLGKVVNGKLDDKGFARVSGLATGSVKVLFDPDPRNPWDEASDFKRKVEWPNQNDVEGSIGIESGSKGLTETLKNDFKKLSQLASNVKSVQQKIESVKKIKDQGAKALLPMAMEQVLGGSDGSKLSQSFVSQNSFMPSSQQSNPLRRLAQASSDKTAITKIQSPFETFV